MKIFEKKIILASKSPRRSQLLRDAGFSFRIISMEVDESFPSEMPVNQVASFLAEKKAVACAHFLEHEEEVLLSADTVVILDDKIYGKPADHADAVKILTELAGRTHTVITGVCLLSKTKKNVFHAVSAVQFNPMTHEEIEFYIQQCQPFDKAGAYGVQEWVGLCKVARIEGTYSNIMGLPMEDVYRELVNF